MSTTRMPGRPQLGKTAYRGMSGRFHLGLTFSSSQRLAHALSSLHNRTASGDASYWVSPAEVEVTTRHPEAPASPSVVFSTLLRGRGQGRPRELPLWRRVGTHVER